MTKQEIIAKVNELIAAPSCCAPIKKAAQDYLKAQDKASADALVKALEADVCSIDELIGLCESEQGKQFFGAEKAAGMAERPRSPKLMAESIAFARRAKLAERSGRTELL